MSNEVLHEESLNDTINYTIIISGDHLHLSMHSLPRLLCPHLLLHSAAVLLAATNSTEKRSKSSIDNNNYEVSSSLGLGQLTALIYYN